MCDHLDPGALLYGVYFKFRGGEGGGVSVVVVGGISLAVSSAAARAAVA